MLEIFCDNCDRYQPLQQGEWCGKQIDSVTDDCFQNAADYEFQDQLCGACHFVIATLRKPLEIVVAPSA